MLRRAIPLFEVLSMDNNNILLSAADDLYNLCERRGCAVFSRFYDGGEQALLQDSRMIYGNSLLFGGNAKCERKMLGVFPEWETPDTDSFPVTLIKCTCSFKKDFTHRDYLGSLMGLGIERDRIGDIVVTEDAGYFFLHNSISDYVISNLKKIGSHGVKVSVQNINEMEYPEGKFAILKTVVASMRLDAVVGGATNLSRSKCAALIEHEKVSVNHRLTVECSAKVAQGDLLSVRGFGRFLVCSVEGETRSGRLHISIKKYL